ncbi:MAG TPA: RNA polymerase-binding ATPase [Verrucomicrobiales bacterium]|nr:RNA polymerase-binding ATPase [Verrucomicrobiales bacterium]
MSFPLPGQRWTSASQPELGLGLIITAEGDRVEICFPAAEEVRQYVFSSAPLIRVHFKEGDRIKNQAGQEFTVEAVEERDGLLVYLCGEEEIREEHLFDALSFIKPEERLLAGQCDDLRSYELRVQALQQNGRFRCSPARGFSGARIDLIPHQLAIAAEAAGRLAPRVLLADEVGLGKTIEACLILHRLHLTGRADRVLILVPEPLVHQWFVELLRRFNLLFAIFDEDRCKAIQGSEGDANPFLDSQLILSATEFLTAHPQRAEEARAAGFDLMIVDEAHHLQWKPDSASHAYSVIESLSEVTASLLLLTATPEQLGPEGHFARLRLLDPERFPDLAGFRQEAEEYEPLAGVVGRLSEGTPLTRGDKAIITERSERSADLVAALDNEDTSSRQSLVRDLIDCFGTGRVMFRNTRERLTGFPERKLHLVRLELSSTDEADPVEVRVDWLADFLQGIPQEKVVLICESAELAESIRTLLLTRIQIESAQFHEKLTLLQRDRNAAWFADPEGARILICSEIGSEGRNFQFAHHLVLFDLPVNPELLEQRIGRLDRIGQTETVNIHVPVVKGSSDELLARWYSEGLDAFEHPLKGASTLLASLGPELKGLQETEEPSCFEDFLKRSALMKEQVSQDLSSGHDRLLELGAPSSESAQTLIEHISNADHDPDFEKFVIRLFDYLGLEVEDLSLRSYIFKKGERLSEDFAEFPEDGLSVTFDRDFALAREDIALITPDHPLFRDAIEVLLSREQGNCSFAHWKTARGKTMLLECNYVLECLGPSRLHIDRFLPPTPYRTVVDHKGNDHSSDEGLPSANLEPRSPRKLVSQSVFRKEILPGMLKKAEQITGEQADSQIARAVEDAGKSLSAEIKRLHDLADKNNKVSPAEIEALTSHRDEILRLLGQSRLRLDALRLIWRTPA